MAKPIEKRRHDEAERAFRKAWKLLDRIERRLERARAEERKRLAQLGDGSGPDAPRRSAQLEAARAEVSQIEGLVTELSELIAGNARASSGQTVKDMATSVAAEIRDEAAEPPQLRARGRNRHHRPRRKPATADAATAPSDAAPSARSSPSAPIALPPPVEVGSVDQPTTAVDAETQPTPTPASKPGTVAYRSLVSQPPDIRQPGRPVADAGEPGAAAQPRDEPTSDGDPTPGADRDDPPAEGA